MQRYFTEAFFARVPTPMLGSVPANAVTFAALMILGFGHPGFWFVGLGLEVAYLWGLVGNARFRKWVDAKSIGEAKDRDSLQWAEWMTRLSPAHQDAARTLARRCEQVRETYRLNQADDSIIENNLAALGRLQALHARLLLARQQLDQREGDNDEAQLLRDAHQLQSELQQAGLPESLARSKRATLEILQKRLRAVGARETTRQEIDSDLKRIVSHVELALDQAAMQTKPPAISLDLELSYQMIDTGPTGPTGPTDATTALPVPPVAN